MAHEILINAGAAEIRVAVVEEGKLQALFCEETLGQTARGRTGDIMLGRVQRVVAAMQAGFVDIGFERAGFLGAREASGAMTGHEPPIGDLIREGDEVLVQIVKDPIGEKGARLSTGVTLPGRLCVLSPLQSGIALSRRIEDEAERTRLSALGEKLLAEESDFPPGAGFIFRTNALGAEYDDLREDALALAGEWRAILAARKNARPPTLLHRDLNALERALRDLVREDTQRIRIDDASAVEAARKFCESAMPQAAARIEGFTGPGALFDDNLEADIERLTHPRAALSSGGWITIESTEALTSVDVNSGSFITASNLEDMSLAVNLEAARELGRQLRLRGIGGVIVADFIHMRDEEHVAQVLEALRHALAQDRAPVSIAPISPFGLVEIIRKRVREPRAHLAGEVCPTCCGEGRVRKPEAIALDVVRRIESTARAAPGKPILVAAAPEIVQKLKDMGEPLLAALARKGAVQLRFEIDENYSRERFDVGTSL